MKKIHIIIWVVLGIIIIILALGIYKFNFTNDDIYIVNTDTKEKTDTINTTEPKKIEYGEVVKDFEGEADPARMTLVMKKWDWVNTLYSDDKIVKPLKENKFSITFNKDKTFSASTDCNGIGGEYTVAGNKITFGKMMSTMMYCEGSQEGEFSKMLSETGSYMFTSKGELVLLLKFDSGSVVFK